MLVVVKVEVRSASRSKLEAVRVDVLSTRRKNRLVVHCHRVGILDQMANKKKFAAVEGEVEAAEAGEPRRTGACSSSSSSSSSSTSRDSKVVTLMEPPATEDVIVRLELHALHREGLALRELHAAVEAQLRRMRSLGEWAVVSYRRGDGGDGVGEQGGDGCGRVESVVLVAAARKGRRGRADNVLRGWARAVDALLGGRAEQEEPLARCRWTGRGKGLVRVDCRVARREFGDESEAVEAEARKEAGSGGEVLASASSRPLLPEE